MNAGLQSSGLFTFRPAFPPLAVLNEARKHLGLHEDEDEDEDGWQDAGAHHPHRKLSVGAQRGDEPITLLRRGHREATGHAQFLGTGNRKNTVKLLSLIHIAAILVLQSLENHGILAA